MGNRAYQGARKIRGANGNPLRRAAALKKTLAGTADPVSPPSQVVIRRHVEAGICPFCGNGPYALLAQHTRSAHAVDKYELRDLAGIGYSTSISSPEMRTINSERMKARIASGDVDLESLRAKRRNRPRQSAVSLANARRLASIGSATSASGRQREVRCSTCGQPFNPKLKGSQTKKTCSDECQTMLRRRPRLDVETVQELHESGLSCNAIAEQLGINRKTAQRYVRALTNPPSG